MKEKDFEALRLSLIALLNDLEKAKKEGEKAMHLSKGGPLQKQMTVFMEQFNHLTRECLKLEQETREI